MDIRKRFIDLRVKVLLSYAALCSRQHAIARHQQDTKPAIPGATNLGKRLA